MVPVVDDFPFPWHKLEAQELHKALCEIYPSSKSALFVAAKANLDTAMIHGDQAPYMVWIEVLGNGATANRNREIVRLARDQNPNNPRRPLLDALLAPAAAEIPLSHEPRADDGSPMFLRTSDDVTEPEALLFHDDLSLPIGRVEWMIQVLRQLQAIAPSVCRFHVNSSAGMQRGTGFRIGPRSVLTNWHVLYLQGAKPDSVTAEFGYDDDGSGGGLPSKAFKCDVERIRGDEKDDWGVLETMEDLPGSIPTIRLADAAEPSMNEPAFIVQHPGGDRKRVTFVRNQITYFDDRVVHYLSDTQAGSSGAPVFNDQGRLIALHHAGGRPQEIAGKPPLRKNEGIRLPRILKQMVELGINLT
jgi:hypothetical protein